MEDEGEGRGGRNKREPICLMIGWSFPNSSTSGLISVQNSSTFWYDISLRRRHMIRYTSWDVESLWKRNDEIERKNERKKERDALVSPYMNKGNHEQHDIFEEKEVFQFSRHLPFTLPHVSSARQFPVYISYAPVASLKPRTTTSFICQRWKHILLNRAAVSALTLNLALISWIPLMSNIFHSELMNEAKHLESMPLNMNTSITIVVRDNSSHLKQDKEEKDNKSCCYPELHSTTSADLSEFTTDEMKRLGTYYNSTNHSQHETFYQNWQNHFQPK